MKNIWIRSLIVSLLVVIGTMVCTDLFFSSMPTGTYQEGEMEAINAMPFEQALAEYTKRTKTVRGIPYILKAYRMPDMWKTKSRRLAVALIFTFAGCLWIGTRHLQTTKGNPQQCT